MHFPIAMEALFASVYSLSARWAVEQSESTEACLICLPFTTKTLSFISSLIIVFLLWLGLIGYCFFNFLLTLLLYFYANHYF